VPAAISNRVNIAFHADTSCLLGRFRFPPSFALTTSELIRILSCAEIGRIPIQWFVNVRYTTFPLARQDIPEHDDALARNIHPSGPDAAPSPHFLELRMVQYVEPRENTKDFPLAGNCSRTRPRPTGEITNKASR
jgi:hypothetical protein